MSFFMPQETMLKEYKKICKNIVVEILGDETKIQSFVEKLKNMGNNEKDIFNKKFNDIILNSIIKNELDININSLGFNNLNNPIFAVLDSPKTIDEKIDILLYVPKNKYTGIASMFLDINNVKMKYQYFEYNMQLLLLELSKMPEKERVLDIFYDIMGDELPNRAKITAEKNNSSKRTDNTETKEEIKTEKSRNIVKKIIMNYVPECRDKLKEIKELSQEFEYAIKSDYHKNCDDIESRLENIENRKEFNKIIDEINNLYRNAYNRKYNKSSLSYVMDVEEDDEINLLEYI